MFFEFSGHLDDQGKVECKLMPSIVTYVHALFSLVVVCEQGTHSNVKYVISSDIENVHVPDLVVFAKDIPSLPQGYSPNLSRVSNFTLLLLLFCSRRKEIQIRLNLKYFFACMIADLWLWNSRKFESDSGLRVLSVGTYFSELHLLLAILWLVHRLLFCCRFHSTDDWCKHTT